MAYGCKLTNNKNGKGNKGVPLKEQHKKNIGISVGRPVRCIETGVIYPSSAHAARALGLKSCSGIYKCCRGTAKTSKSYHWEFVK